MGSHPHQGWEQLFWTVFTRTANPVALLDQERRFVDLNEPTLTAFKRTRGELLTRPVTEIIVPAEQQVAEQQWEAFLASGEFSGNRTFIRGDGEEVSYELAGRLTTINGAARALYVIIADPWEPTPGPTPEGGKRLTPREREVVGLIAMGLDTRDIAGRLFISPETVRTHVRNAMHRLNVHTRAQLVCVALTSQPTLDLLQMED